MACGEAAAVLREKKVQPQDAISASGLLMFSPVLIKTLRDIYSISAQRLILPSSQSFTVSIATGLRSETALRRVTGPPGIDDIWLRRQGYAMMIADFDIDAEEGDARAATAYK